MIFYTDLTKTNNHLIFYIVHILPHPGFTRWEISNTGSSNISNSFHCNYLLLIFKMNLPPKP